MNKYIEKENKNYLARDKKCNVLDLELYKFYDFVEGRDGDSELERYILCCLEREINQLRYTIECYKKEHDRIHWETVERLKDKE